MKLSKRKFHQNSLVWLSAFLLLTLSAHPQQPHTLASTSGGGSAPVTTAIAILPDDKDDKPDPNKDLVPRIGFNAALIYTNTHDSESGWSQSATPFASYVFNKNFSADLSCPIYIVRHAADTEIAPKPGASLVPVTKRGETGDTLLSTHAAFSNSHFDYMATFSATVPSGDVVFGLSTGRMTFDLTHDFTRYFGIFGPGVEIGVGDSNSLSNSKVVQDYISLGPLAHFQLGSTIDLPHHSLFEADAYENLPIGDQKIYTDVVLRHQTTTEVLGTHVSEDNGFTAELDIPLASQMVISGFYNRSRRFSVDTAGIALTFMLRNPRMTSRDSRVQKQLDDLIR